jgi:hypothetical protein
MRIKFDPTTITIKVANERELLCSVPWIQRYGFIAVILSIWLTYRIGMLVAGTPDWSAPVALLFAMAICSPFLWVTVGRIHETRIDIKVGTVVHRKGLWPFVSVQRGKIDKDSKLEVREVKDSALHWLLRELLMRALVRMVGTRGFTELLLHTPDGDEFLLAGVRVEMGAELRQKAAELEALYGWTVDLTAEAAETAEDA